MRYKLLGKSGLRVSELCLGTMTFGEDWGWGASRADSQRMFDAYAEAGGNFIDTAINYTNGTAEGYVGEFIQADRHHFVVATKYTLFTRHGDPNASGNQRKNLVQSLEKSLRRLKTDYVDIYQVHAWDFCTPVEEVMRALDDAVRAGKVLYTGVSDAPAWAIARGNTLADLRGWSPFIVMQLRYSLADRGIEREHLPLAQAMDIGLMAWSVLGAGLLSGKYSRGGTGRRSNWDSGPTEQEQRILAAVEAVAADLGCQPAHVAINWVRAQQGAIPILGATRAEQLRDNLECLRFPLEPEHLQRLNEASRIDLGFPYEFLASDSIRNLVYGGTFGEIDTDRIPG
jgi:aryl-alcohol dehydrogenase-like predicted oxidoreductase